MKDLLIALLLATIVALKLIDLMADMALDLPAAHLWQEWVLLGLSAAGCIFLIRDIRRRTVAMQQLRETLNLSDARLQTLGDQLREARRAFALTIRDQFQAWQLTQSEQEIAMLMLKGLSLQEIATLRETREKTVRQHASNIYGKAGVDGRHALAAWFLEDLIAERPAP
ncbi:MAG: LuxR C-terminal-related transcriptional regulator [Halieaceae bacterium]|jgi:DNA-binding CsgD family transcriptional regulator|nr:LuxR C-terminal-related transcriptional regulator [Halieaceae bacterium]